MNISSAVQEIKDNGYVLFKNYYQIDFEKINVIETLLDDKNYSIGKIYKTNNINSLDNYLKNLVSNTYIKNIFEQLVPDIKCQEIFISHEFKNKSKERNNYLHFDRLRCLKAIVYLKDVDSIDNGPFSIVPKTHNKSAELRRSFKNESNYENKKNRIDIDYINLYKEPIPILGKAGTLVLFDTDTWHLGGIVQNNCERKVIRSHWYVNSHWRINS